MFRATRPILSALAAKQRLEKYFPFSGERRKSGTRHASVVSLQKMNE